MMTNKVLKEKIKSHKQWLDNDGGVRLDLSNVKLLNADLSNCDLSYSDLTYASLVSAILRNAKMSYVILRNADLRKADLSYVNLRISDLRNADLSNASVISANLSSVNLRLADLRNCDLSNSNLSNADLRNADLRYSDLTYASLSNAQLDERELCRLGEYLHEPLQGWKKCKDGVIVELEIPAGAIVFSINNSKCRTNKAKVIGIEGASKGISYHQDMSYYVGDVLDIIDFNVQYNIECEKGIHFFKKKDDAIRY